MKTINVAIAGNPNSGKTTLFNTLTGGNHYVGNWPGVTVEKKEGKKKYKGHDYNLVDLPGIYSLAPFSIEEIVAREYILDEKPDVVINVVDGTLLERNLYLTTQLMALSTPMVLAINMMDELEKKDIQINIEKMSKQLGFPVVLISAQNKLNIDTLLDQATVMAQSKALRYSDAIPILSALEEADYSEEMISAKRYEYIDLLLKSVMVKENEIYDTQTAKLDNWLLNEYVGFPVFLAIMAFVFYMTFRVGGIFLNSIDVFFSDILGPSIDGLLSSAGVAEWMNRLVVDGIIGGVGGVLTFVPNIAILFFFISLLEDSGYMARVAYIMDKGMAKFGLNGRTFVPMILGFGCNVPAIMATRTIENEKDRLLSILINPFVSCGARFPVYVLFASVFFKGYETLVTFSLYVLGIVVALLVAVIFRKTIFRENESHFIMELPVYRLPNLKSLFIHVWERVKGYLVKAGTIIFAASVILWFTLNFNTTGMVTINESFGASIGKLMAPIMAPLGFGSWQISLSLLTGMLAKEMIISNMAIVLGVTDGSTTFLTALSGTFEPLTAYVFMVFVLLYTPCVAVIAVIKRETNSWKWTGFSVIYQFVVAWLVAFLFYRVGLLFF